MKLSIITINLNNVIGIRKTILSVINQTFKDFDYIIIDGGSTDGSVEVIKEFTDHITYWISESDRGIYNAMNKGILKARGEYLQFLNSGDWLVNENVLSQVFSNNENSDILYGDLIKCFSSGKKTLLTFKHTKISLQGLIYNQPILHPSSFIKKKLFENDLYDENYKVVSDWIFILKKIVLESCSTYYIGFPIAYFNTEGISERQDTNHIVVEERQLALSKIFPPLILSDIQEYQNLKNFKPVRHIYEIQKLKGFRYLIFGFIRITLRLYQKLLLILGCKI
jgi:glycosyltransferase involved in cell wall biosynthesis